MKKGLLYLLLFSYSMVMLKPILPFMTDTVAHIFWYSEHMATVHYEKGKYHMHFESLDAAKKSGTEKSPATNKTEKGSSEHVMIFSQYDFSILLLPNNSFPNEFVHIPHNWLSNSYHPPKLV